MENYLRMQIWLYQIKMNLVRGHLKSAGDHLKPSGEHLAENKRFRKSR